MWFSWRSVTIIYCYMIYILYITLYVLLFWLGLGFIPVSFRKLIYNLKNCELFFQLGFLHFYIRIENRFLNLNSLNVNTVDPNLSVDTVRYAVLTIKTSRSFSITLCAEVNRVMWICLEVQQCVVMRLFIHYYSNWLCNCIYCTAVYSIDIGDRGHTTIFQSNWLDWTWHLSL